MSTNLATSSNRASSISSTPPRFCEFMVLSVVDESNYKVYHLRKDGEQFTMKVNMEDDVQEGPASIVRENGTVYKEVSFSGIKACGDWIAFDGSGHLVASGILDGIIREYNKDGSIKWMGKYREGKRYSELKPSATVYGFYEEYSLSGDLLSIAQYDKEMTKQSGTCYYFCENRIVSEYTSLNGESRIVRSFSGDVMTEFDEHGKIVYRGKYRGSIRSGFVADWNGGNSAISFTKRGHTVEFIREESKKKGCGQKLWMIWLLVVACSFLLYEIVFTVKMSFLTDNNVVVLNTEEYRHLIQWKLDQLESLEFDPSFGTHMKDFVLTLHAKRLRKLKIGIHVRS